MAHTAEDTTLLTEHLTYRPAALIDDIINSINTYAYRAIDAVERGLLTAPASSLGVATGTATAAAGDAASSDPPALLPDPIRLEIESGVHQLETLLEAKIDRNFDRFEVYALRNIFSVPPDVRDWVRLRHYEGLDARPLETMKATATEDARAAQDAERIDRESIMLKRRKLREVEKLGVLLRTEKARNARTLARLRLLLGKSDAAPGDQPGANGHVKAEETRAGDGSAEDTTTREGAPFAFLFDRDNALTGSGTNPLGTTADFAMSQLPALQSYLHDLEARVARLDASATNENDDDAASGPPGVTSTADGSSTAWNRERTHFIERETRRHLERVRGLELGDMGGVRDGEWQGEGRRLGADEAADLERVVALVAGPETATTTTTTMQPDQDRDPDEMDTGA